MLTERRNRHWPSVLRTRWWCDLFRLPNLFCTFVPRAIGCLCEVMKRTLSERKIGGVADVAYAEHGDCPLEIPCVVHPALCIAPEKLGLCKRGVAFLEPRWRIPRSSGGGTSGWKDSLLQQTRCIPLESRIQRLEISHPSTDDHICLNAVRRAVRGWTALTLYSWSEHDWSRSLASYPAPWQF